MDTALQEFSRQFAGVVAATLTPVIIVTFLWVPYTLGRHPGESACFHADCATLRTMDYCVDDLPRKVASAFRLECGVLDRSLHEKKSIAAAE
jgi:hypothetical protein